MENATICKNAKLKNISSYQERKKGNVTLRITYEHKGNKNLGMILDEIAVDKITLNASKVIGYKHNV